MEKFFDMTVNFNWNMTPVNRTFDPYKIRKYLSQLTEPDRSFIWDLLDKTSYICYSDFKKMLLLSFELFRQEIGQQCFYLMLPHIGFGSEHWTVALLWPQIKQLNLQKIINDVTKMSIRDGIINVLMVDDAIYTGNNTIYKIDNITYELAYDLDLDRKDAGKYFHFHIVIPFGTHNGINFLHQNCKDFGTQCTVYDTICFLSLSKLTNIDKYYPQNAIDIVHNRFGIENMDNPPIYFDHKVACETSTFRSIYLLGCIDRDHDNMFGSLFQTDPSREQIEKLGELFKTTSK